jgi:hypothetical protein
MHAAATLLFCLVTVLPARAGLLDQFSDADMTTGLRDALKQGAVNAVSRLGKEDGFFKNSKVKIPLPGPLKKIESVMRTVGMKKQADELILTMNRAAEAAVPEAQTLFVDAIKSMSVKDAMGILKGKEDSATQYFRSNTEEPLRAKFHPIVAKATEKLGLAAQYNDLAGRAAKLKLLDEKDANVENYVTQKALDGLFLMIADEEKNIRKNPVKATTDIARKIFEGLR